MSVSHKYFVPDYYDSFECKGPNCRSTCCCGWNISMSMPEYYKLIGMQCSKMLRRRLDGAMQIVERPDAAHYAQIVPRWDGDCPLHREDGFCALQRECGEGALSAVCRYYPRSPRSDFLNECSCSNSCEAVLELMFERKAPLAFREEELSFELPAESRHGARENAFLAEYHEIRKNCIMLMQNRRAKLSERLLALGELICALDERQKTNSLEHKRSLARIFAKDYFLERKHEKADALFGVTVSLRMAAWCADENESLRELFDGAYALLGASGQKDECVPAENALSKYREAQARLHGIIPEIETYMEHVMVNHMFYECFPYSDKHENMWDEYAALCAVYALIRLYTVSGVGDGGVTRFTDILAKAFRFIEHTSFDRNAAVLLYNEGCLDKAGLKSLIWA